MNQLATRQPIEIDYNAEGSFDDSRQPFSQFKTATFRALEVTPTSDLPISETGTVVAAPESVDKTEGQDAPRTTEEAKPAPEAPTATANGKTKVLIVEDTVELAEVIQATLESMGLSAIYATHGKIGIEKMKDISPEMVIMDIGLPDITGWKMLDSIKEHYTGSNMKMPTIIVITAYGDPANRLIGKLQNIHSYLIKPFTPDEVEKLVKMALRGEAPPENHADGQKPLFGL
jgi:CheY-like chemotaxis protein